MAGYGVRGPSVGWIRSWFLGGLRRETSRPAVEPEELAASNLAEEQPEGAADKLVEDEAVERAESGRM